MGNLEMHCSTVSVDGLFYVILKIDLYNFRNDLMIICTRWTLLTIRMNHEMLLHLGLDLNSSSL